MRRPIDHGPDQLLALQQKNKYSKIRCIRYSLDRRGSRARTQAFREAVGGASSELFSPADKKAENAVVKKLKQPKKRRRKKKDTDGKKADGAVGAKEGGQGGDVGDDEEEEGEEEGEEEEEEEKGGVASLMIVKTAGEAWERLQERLKEAPIIQARLDL